MGARHITLLIDGIIGDNGTDLHTSNGTEVNIDTHILLISASRQDKVPVSAIN